MKINKVLVVAALVIFSFSMAEASPANLNINPPVFLQVRRPPPPPRPPGPPRAPRFRRHHRHHRHYRHHSRVNVHIRLPKPPPPPPAPPHP